MNEVTKENIKENSFISRLNALYGDEYTVISPYVSMRKKIRIRHNSEKCRFFEWDVFPQNILNGHKCPKCSGRIVMTREEFLKELGNEYTLKSEYHGIQQPVCIEHHKPEIHAKNSVFYISPKQFKQGKKCPECERLKESAAIAKKIQQMTNGEYTMIGEFYSKSEKIAVRHNCEKCNYHEWKILPYNFMAGHRCPKCKRPGRKSLN